MLPEIIAKLLRLSGSEGTNTNDVFWEIDEILDAYKPEGYTVEVVDSEFENGGRWSNFETTVYRVEQSGVVAYFELWQEVAATEIQDGEDYPWSFSEVEPKEVTVIEYVAKERD